MKSFHPQRRMDLEVREVEGNLLVLDRRQGKIHQFNTSAALIWQHCDGRHSVAEIVDRVSAMYGAPVDTVRGDVNAAIEEFMGLGLLTTEVAHEGSKT
jgi:hypothetical protein